MPVGVSSTNPPRPAVTTSYVSNYCQMSFGGGKGPHCPLLKPLQQVNALPWHVKGNLPNYKFLAEHEWRIWKLFDLHNQYRALKWIIYSPPMLTGLLNHFERFVIVRGKLSFVIMGQKRRGHPQSLRVILWQCFIIPPTSPNPVLKGT